MSAASPYSYLKDSEIKVLPGSTAAKRLVVLQMQRYVRDWDIKLLLPQSSGERICTHTQESVSVVFCRVMIKLNMTCGVLRRGIKKNAEKRSVEDNKFMDVKLKEQGAKSLFRQIRHIQQLKLDQYTSSTEKTLELPLDATIYQRLAIVLPLFYQTNSHGKIYICIHQALMSKSFILPLLKCSGRFVISQLPAFKEAVYTACKDSGKCGNKYAI